MSLSERRGADDALFRRLYECSGDAILLLDPTVERVIDGNLAAVDLTGVRDREALIQADLGAFSPEFQADGRAAGRTAKEMIREVLARGHHRFAWLMRRPDGVVIPLEVMGVRVQAGAALWVALICRDLRERAAAEEEIRRLNASLERHVAERTAELVQANEQLKREIEVRQRREQLLQATYQISEAAQTAGDLSSLYARVHAIVKTLMPAENFYIALLDAETEMISFPYFVDVMADAEPAPRPIGTGLTGVVLRTGKPLLADADRTAQVRRVGDAVMLPGVDVPYVEVGKRAAVWLGVPLLRQGRAFGVMAVQDYQHEGAYGETEQQVLIFVAEQTALAIERKRTEQALRDSEEQHRALFEAASQGVMLHDDKAFFSVNPAAVRILGYERAEDLIGKHPAETSAPIQPNGERADILARRHIEDCLRDGQTRFEWTTRDAHGREFPLDVRLTAVEVGGRKIIQAVLDDISERKRAEAELLRTLAREKELGQLRSNFVSMVSHEFRTPLAIIQSSSEILEDYLDRLEPEERRQHLQSVRRNTQRMTALMEEVLLIGQFEAGRMEFKPVPVDLGVALRRLVEEVLSATDHRCPIEARLGELPGEARVDERLLRHLLTNLLVNAVKYSEPGQPVSLLVERDGAELILRVRDTGIGIPESDLEWLFHAFHRGRNVGDRPGTGLGLVIVKRCVDLHGGRIRVESVLGEGTTMHVWLPLFG